MSLMSTTLATFGSRFSIILDPYNYTFTHGSLGMFLGNASKLFCGMRTSQLEDMMLPFCGKDHAFDALYMDFSMNSVSYTAICKKGSLDMEVKFTSPFSPEDEVMNIAPVFYVDVKISSNPRPHNLIRPAHKITQGTFIFGINGDDVDVVTNENYCDIGYKVETIKRFVMGDFAKTKRTKVFVDGKEVTTLKCIDRVYSMDNAKSGADGLFEIPFDLSNNETFTTKFIVATYFELDNFISKYGEPCNLLYREHFKDIDQVCQYGAENYAIAMDKSHYFDSLFAHSSLSKSWKDFIAFTFQSYKMNTFYFSGHDGKRAFHVWEGNCMFNSTMDVEYNDGLAYYTILPQMLPTLIDQWASTENGNGYISHDLGSGYQITKACYPHAMQVEENANFIQMLFANYMINGDISSVQKHFDTVMKLVQFIYDADTTGNGIPNVGTANTIDDAIPAIQHAKEQTYLAIKTAATLHCVIQMAKAIGREDVVATADERARKIVQTVDTQLWRGDHYGVCLDETQDGYKAFITKEELTGPMVGRDSYSIYAENGLLYPSMTGDLPPFFNYSRHVENINMANEKCMTQYGCNHSEDSDSIWISQNLWKDFNAAYLGHDFLDNVDRYWDFQRVQNSNGNTRLFIDTVGENCLWFYPRGFASIGVLYAMIRLQINSIKKEITINPLRNSIKIPLLLFADYQAKRTPWVIYSGGEVVIENEDLLKGYKVKLVV